MGGFFGKAGANCSGAPATRRRAGVSRRDQAPRPAGSGRFSPPASPTALSLPCLTETRSTGIEPLRDGVVLGATTNRTRSDDPALAGGPCRLEKLCFRRSTDS